MSIRTTDPITQEIAGNALASIADEMATTIFRTAHSTVVRDGMDFSAALCDASGETVAQAVTVPFHLGSVPHAMETLLAKWGGRMRSGDVFVMNDPFDGGIHLQDIFVFRPVFADEELIGFATTTAHHGDVGGRLPGSAACDNTEIFQEGIRLPWLKLYEDGRPVDTDPSDDARRPGGAGCGDDGGRAGAPAARAPLRHGTARGAHDGAGGAHRAARPAGDRGVAGRDGLVQRTRRR